MAKNNLGRSSAPPGPGLKTACFRVESTDNRAVSGASGPSRDDFGLSAGFNYSFGNIHKQLALAWFGLVP